jgi:hypothetical protein
MKSFNATSLLLLVWHEKLIPQHIRSSFSAHPANRNTPATKIV